MNVIIPAEDSVVMFYRSRDRWYGHAFRLGLAVFALCAIVRTTSAGTIRDDRQDRLYTGLSALPHFRASGYVGIRTGTELTGSGSATLIAPNWLLTAAHLVYDEEGPTGDSWTFEIGDQVLEVPERNVFFPQGWVTSGFDSGFDVALIRLPAPVRGVRPAAISQVKDEVGKVMVTVGYGMGGDGFTGATEEAGTRRAGQNTIDATNASILAAGFEAQGTLLVGNARTLLYDFDNPQGTASTLGQRMPLNLEYSAAAGDAGGAAFSQVGGGVRIIGVASAGWTPVGLDASAYGTTVVYARVSENVAWIRNAMAGREPSSPVLQARLPAQVLQQAVKLAQQRVDEATRKGFRFQRFIAIPVTPLPDNLPDNGVSGPVQNQGFVVP